MSRSCRFVVAENEDTARIEQNQHLIERKLHKNSKTHGRMSHYIQVSIVRKRGTSVYTADCSVYQQSEQLTLI